MTDLKILLPIIRNIEPMSMMENIASVQPMTEDIGFSMAINTDYVEPHYRFGSMIHDFIYGWKVFDCNDWITLDEFYEKYPDLNYEELSNLTNNWRLAHWKPEEKA